MNYCKKVSIAIVGFTSLLTSEEMTSSFPQASQKEIFEEKCQFFYIAAGVNPLPTLSLGYRMLYGSFGSDISLNGSVYPFFAVLPPVPGILYKQLFFTRSWKRLEIGRSVFYWGLQTGIYPFGDFTVNGGVLSGWQFKRKSRSDFFEIGINPILYNDEGLRLVPLVSFTYGFMF
jgi:hypothetical protein